MLKRTIMIHHCWPWAGAVICSQVWALARVLSFGSLLLWLSQAQQCPPDLTCYVWHWPRLHGPQAYHAGLGHNVAWGGVGSQLSERNWHTVGVFSIPLKLEFHVFNFFLSHFLKPTMLPWLLCLSLVVYADCGHCHHSPSPLPSHLTPSCAFLLSSSSSPPHIAAAMMGGWGSDRYLFGGPTTTIAYMMTCSSDYGGNDGLGGPPHLFSQMFTLSLLKSSLHCYYCIHQQWSRWTFSCVAMVVSEEGRKRGVEGGGGGSCSCLPPCQHTNCSWSGAIVGGIIKRARKHKHLAQ